LRKHLEKNAQGGEEILKDPKLKENLGLESLKLVHFCV
jgi:hypothetical protein